MKIKVLLFALVIGSLGLMTSCSDDYSPAPPVITYPSNGNPQVIAPGESIDFTFTVYAERGYANHLLTWTSGSVIENSIAIPDGEQNFTVSGQFTAGTDFSGPGGVSLAVSDKEGSTSLATIAVIVQ